jgi:hypothetical protein
MELGLKDFPEIILADNRPDLLQKSVKFVLEGSSLYFYEAIA